MDVYKRSRWPEKFTRLGRAASLIKEETDERRTLTNSQKVRNSVMPAKAGIQNYLKTLDSRFRGNDAKGRFKTFYETIKIVIWDLFVIWSL